MPATTVTPGAGFTSATAAFTSNWPNDTTGIVTFTTASTIPGSGPYLIFTITFCGSWASQYAEGLTVLVGACATALQGRSAAYMAASAALGPFFAIPNLNQTTCAVYCTNAPATTTGYDIGYIISQGP